MATDRDTLPSTVKPSHYDISLFDLELGGAWSYKGTVKINLEVKEAVKQIVLNLNDIKIEQAEIATGSHHAKVSNVTYDSKSFRASLDFAEAVPASKDAVLTINFTGTINNTMAGFYRSRYIPDAPPAASVPKDDQYHYMTSTQFEACDARRAFPCFDEPNLKATYDFEIEIPDDQVALSNMPEKSTRPGSKPGLKFVSFQRTPVMSTYLLAWAVGDFEYIEAFTDRKYGGKQLPVRVYTTKGLKAQGELAVNTATKVLDLFSEWFEIEYPLPKSDLLAVHEFTHGAMENWGLVTYRKVAVLYDEGKSDTAYKIRVAYVVAHELAHQWFGNLVTMDWWNELWLNEGFATWVGWAAIDKLHPEWDVWSRFCTESLQQGLDLDGLRTSHPIEVPVRDALEVDQIFDSISYQKGSSVIRMLSAHLGRDVFLKGVSTYLKKHAYGNATTNDLWAGISEVSGKNIKGFMDNWIGKIGFPAVTVAEEPGQITVGQKRFLTSGDVKPDEDTTQWWIPLGLRSGMSNTQSHQGLALSGKTETVRNIDDSFYKVNSDQTGFYRTNYPPPRLLKLAETKDKLSNQDKVGVIADAGALAMSGEGTTAGLLSFVESFQAETNYYVWSQIVSSLGDVRGVFADNEKISAALRKFTLKLVTPTVERIGWKESTGEDYLTGRLRAMLIGTAGLAGHQGIIEEAKRQFDAYLNKGDKSAIHANLRSAVWRITQTNGGRAEYEALKKHLSDTSTPDGKDIALTAMGRVQSEELINEFCNFVFSGAVAVGDFHLCTSSMSGNARARPLHWEFIKANWSKVSSILEKNKTIMNIYFSRGLGQFSDAAVAEDIAKFFSDKDTAGYDRGLSVVESKIKMRAAYRQRDAASLLEWLSAHGYA